MRNKFKIIAIVLVSVLLIGAFSTPLFYFFNKDFKDGFDSVVKVEQTTETNGDNSNEINSSNSKIQELETEIAELELSLSLSNGDNAELQAELDAKNQELADLLAENELLDSELSNKNEILGSIEICDVIFDIDGVEISKKVASGSTVIAPEVSEKDGYVFVGWKEDGSDNIYNSEICVSSDISLTAVYKDLYSADEINFGYTDFSDFSVSMVWSFDNNVYYSQQAKQYKLNKETNTWEIMTWFGYSPVYGSCIWFLDNNVYYSSGSSQYKLNKETNTWETMTWSGYSSFDGSYIWFLDNNVYYSSSSNQYKLNKETNTWETMTWSGLSSFSGSNVWFLDNNVYYSSGSSQYKLNKETNTWETMTWSGLSSFNGANVLVFIDYVYCFASSSKNYILDETTDTWSSITFNGDLNLVRNGSLWSDGSNFYSFYSSSFYLIDLLNLRLKFVKFHSPLILNSVNIWTDGFNSYYSNGTKHYILDEVSYTWTPFSWSWANGSTNSINILGQYIWTDGDNYFYSYNGYNYILFLDDFTMLSCYIGNSSSNVTGDYVWNLDGNTYFSKNSTHYKFNKDTFVWETMTWSGLTSFNGKNVFQVGSDVFYITKGMSYKLDKETSTWSYLLSPENSISKYSELDLFVYNDTLYSFCYTDFYYYNFENNEWIVVDFDDLYDCRGSYVWFNGSNIFVTSSDGFNYKLYL